MLGGKYATQLYIVCSLFMYTVYQRDVFMRKSKYKMFRTIRRLEDFTVYFNYCIVKQGKDSSKRTPDVETMETFTWD